MVVAFNENRERKFNNFNKKSMKIRTGDFDSDDFEVVNAYDDKGNMLLDAEIYCPLDKTYIIINRIHIKDKDKQKEILEQFMGYLLCPNNLNYVAATIYVDVVGFNIAEDVLQELGFFPKTPNIFVLLNWSFEEALNTQEVSDDVRTAMMQDYLALKDKKFSFMNTIRKQLLDARNALQYFQVNPTNRPMIDAKETEIQYLENILQSGEGRK